MALRPFVLLVVLTLVVTLIFLVFVVPTLPVAFLIVPVPVQTSYVQPLLVPFVSLTYAVHLVVAVTYRAFLFAFFSSVQFLLVLVRKPYTRLILYSSFVFQTSCPTSY